MTSSTPSYTPAALGRLLVDHWVRWLLPAMFVAAAAVVYALYYRADWEAVQALIVRNEAAATHDAAPGKFRQPEDMKTVQETILELVKGRMVLSAALKEAGPPAAYEGDLADYPSCRDVAGLRRKVKLAPPKGAEFGKTEVFYLEVRDTDRERALALNRAICTQLTLRLQQLRNVRAQSMIDELSKAVAVAQADLEAATSKLTLTESCIGGDLSELRAMGDTPSGDSGLGRTVTQIRTEIRDVETARQANLEVLACLKAAQSDPQKLLSAPARLFDAQPALRRLKEGLVDAQLSTARLAAKLNGDHPHFLAAKQAEAEITAQLNAEVAGAIEAMHTELKVNADRVTLLQSRLDDATTRLGELAELRATYVNQLAEAKHRATLVERSRQHLAEARATQAAANASSLIAAIDTADTGASPAGPSRTLIVLGGGLGGLVLGIGVLLLTTAPTVSIAAAAAAQRELATKLSAFFPKKVPAAKPTTRVLVGSGR